jgi:hypothetical protein
MTVLRGITTLGLCLFLALTSVTLAVARGAPRPVALLVICSGEGLAHVALDARGQPVAPQHACPDCLLAFHATAPRDPLPARHATLTCARTPFADARHTTDPLRPAMLARAPPRLA